MIKAQQVALVSFGTSNIICTVLLLLHFYNRKNSSSFKPWSDFPTSFHSKIHSYTSQGNHYSSIFNFQGLFKSFLFKLPRTYHAIFFLLSRTFQVIFFLPFSSQILISRTFPVKWYVQGLFKSNFTFKNFSRRTFIFKYFSRYFFVSKYYSSLRKLQAWHTSSKKVCVFLRMCFSSVSSRKFLFKASEFQVIFKPVKTTGLTYLIKKGLCFSKDVL